MRIVFLGAGSLAVMTANALLKNGHDVIIIEKDKTLIETLSADLECGFVHGDGSKPAILRETNPTDVDYLFCLTGSDQVNIITSLLGRSLGFNRVITKIEDPEFEHICIELGLKDTIVPDQAIGRYLADMIEGQDLLALSAVIKDDARVFSFVIHAENEVLMNALQLPDESRIMCLYRDGKFKIPGAGYVYKIGDEVVILTHSCNLPWLNKQLLMRPEAMDLEGKP
ncbi:MAG: trk system potassium uptake protein [Methyloprofundus sp.]|nr:MAG: trk system potassium uptake protein [Methyloprofundus sp.]